MDKFVIDGGETADGDVVGIKHRKCGLRYQWAGDQTPTLGQVYLAAIMHRCGHDEWI